MPIPMKEALAGIRLLVCMAKADGVLKAEERDSLQEALAHLPLPGGLTVDGLLAEKNDPRALASEISSAEGRDGIYASVLAMACSDRELAAAEEWLLESLRIAWGLQKTEDQELLLALESGHQTEPPVEALAAPPADEVARNAEFNKLLTRYCILTAITGAVPIPLIPDLLVIPMQVKMVYDVAALFGQRSNRGTTQLMFETLGVGTGVRIGVSSLSKLVPGWGSAVGAAAAYTTTYALGKVAWKYYESEGATSLEALKPAFQAARTEGKAEFGKHKAALEEAQKAHGSELKELAYQLQQGKITSQEYESQVDALGS